MKAVIGKSDFKGKRAEVIATELGYLWSNLLQRGAMTSHRSIGFCAIGDDEGSNMLAANLALFLGSQGRRPALVEATLRAPVMADLFGATGTPGLAELLAGKAVLRDVLRQQVATGVDLLPAGGDGDPFWGFTNERFQKVLQELLLDHDLCLIDVPGLNRAPEASLVIRTLDAVVLVIEANRHGASVIRRNIDHLRSLGTPLFGMVLNEVVHEIPRFLHRML